MPVLLLQTCRRHCLDRLQQPPRWYRPRKVAALLLGHTASVIFRTSSLRLSSGEAPASPGQPLLAPPRRCGAGDPRWVLACRFPGDDGWAAIIDRSLLT